MADDVDTRQCGACLMDIPLKATRCPYCTTRYFNLLQQVAFGLIVLVILIFVYSVMSR